MSNRLKVFLNKHDIFYKSQYGFRERRSTEHAILDIGESLFTLFASLTLSLIMTSLSLSDDANKLKTLNIERA